MITVDQKELIRREFFLNRKSMREIAKELRHGRATIRKAIYDPGIPIYKRSVPAPKRSIGPYVGIIQQWLQRINGVLPSNGIQPNEFMNGFRPNTVIKVQTGRYGGKSTVKR
jgi:hypothetical protein